MLCFLPSVHSTDAAAEAPRASVTVWGHAAGECRPLTPSSAGAPGFILRLRGLPTPSVLRAGKPSTSLPDPQPSWACCLQEPRSPSV